MSKGKLTIDTMLGGMKQVAADKEKAFEQWHHRLSEIARVQGSLCLVDNIEKYPRTGFERGNSPDLEYQRLLHGMREE